jgi:hypothetical protein
VSTVPGPLVSPLIDRIERGTVIALHCAAMIAATAVALKKCTRECARLTKSRQLSSYTSTLTIVTLKPANSPLSISDVSVVARNANGA